MFEEAEHIFNFMSLTIGVFVVGMLYFSVASGRNNWHSPHGGNLLTEFIGVVPLVG